MPLNSGACQVSDGNISDCKFKQCAVIW